MKRVLVVIPVFNNAEHLRETFASLLSQSYRDFAVAVVDDGSTDGSGAIVERIARENPQIPIALTTQANSGQRVAQITAIASTDSEMIFPLDADDQLTASALAELVAALDRTPRAAFAYCDIQWFGTKNWLIRSEPWDVERIKAMNYVCGNSLIRREAYDAVGGYRPEEAGLADWGLWLSMAEAGMCGVHVPRPLFRYRQRAGSSSQSIPPALRAHLTEMLRRGRPGLFGGDA